MKKKHLSSLAATTALACFTALAMTAALTGCQTDDPMPAGKTPLALAGITIEVQAAGAPASRATATPSLRGAVTRAEATQAANTFFVKDDAANVVVTPKEGIGGTTKRYLCTYAADGSFTAPTDPDDADAPIYFEDVYDPVKKAATHTFYFEYGGDGNGNAKLVPNQSTAALQHTADAVSGELTLDPAPSLRAQRSNPVLYAAAPLSRLGTRLEFKIEQGDGWASDDAFADALKAGNVAAMVHTESGKTDDGKNILALNESGSGLLRDARNDVATFSAILPPGEVLNKVDDDILTLDWDDATSARPNATLTLTGGAFTDPDIDIEPGYQHTITATLHASGKLVVTSIKLSTWNPGTVDWNGDGDPATAYDPEAERERFMNWAAAMNAGTDPAEYGDGPTGTDFYLRCNIDMTGQEFTTIALPEGDSYTGYPGKFDGCGYTITGLTPKAPSGDDAGLFAQIVTTGTVRRLTLKGVTIPKKFYAGGITGLNFGLIELCTVTGKVEGADAGGIAGGNAGIVAGCHVDAMVTAMGANGGGIVGMNYGTVAACLVQTTGSNEIEGMVAGGIVGYNYAGGTITGSLVQGAINVSGDKTGAIAGNNPGTITACCLPQGKTAVGLNSTGTANTIEFTGDWPTEANYEAMNAELDAASLGYQWDFTDTSNPTVVEKE